MTHILGRMRFGLDHRWAPPHMSAYLDAELTSRRRQRMQRHVSECQECRRLLAGLRAMLALLDALPAQGADSGRIAAAVRLRLG